MIRQLSNEIMKTRDFSGIRTNRPLPNPGDLEIPEDIADMLEDYADSTFSLLDELERAAMAYESGIEREDNAASVRRILHKIKGEAAMMGVDDVSELCHEAEYAFEEFAENQRTDMLLRLKDWICAAIESKRH